MKGRPGQRTWAVAAMPLLLVALAGLLLHGELGPAAGLRHAFAWALLVATGLFALVRWGVRLWRAAPRTQLEGFEIALLCALAAHALAQATGGAASPLFPLVYLVGAGAVLLLPLVPALAVAACLLGLDALLRLHAARGRPVWPLLLAHASFLALFGVLYHVLLGARLWASRRAEAEAVRRRVADAEERARELRLVATAEPSTDPDSAEELDAEQRHLLAGVGHVEELLRGAVGVAEAALRPHAVALYLNAPDSSELRLREGWVDSGAALATAAPLREGFLAAVLSGPAAVRLDRPGAALPYASGRPETSGALGVPLRDSRGELLGVLAADRVERFTPDDERVLVAIGAEVVRAVEAERLLGAVRREKDGRTRFFRALEDLNRTTALAQAAEVAVLQARRLCPALDFCAVTLAERTAGGRVRHRIAHVEGEGAGALAGLSFADNAGLVANVVKLGAPLPGRALAAMERVVIFDNGTVLRGLKALRILPLRSGEQTLGTLVCGSRRPDALQGTARHDLAMLASQAAAALVRTRLFEEAERLATTDGLTGLLNRRTFDAQLDARLLEAVRYGRPLSLLLLDVDHFKKVNDTHGHPAGDAVLRGVAALAQSKARATDFVARYGGEEMALILPETDSAGAAAIAERVRAAVEATSHATDEGSIRVTVSVGVASSPADGATRPELLEAADRALYKAKRAGRNRVETAAA